MSSRNYGLNIKKITLALLFLSATLLLPMAIKAQENSNGYKIPGDPGKGWELFFNKQCIKCHAIWGYGGTAGTDFGRSQVTHLSSGELVGLMWNYVPRMWTKMDEEGIDLPQFTEDEMADLFAFLYFIRYIDEPGNAEDGRKLLEEKGCAKCHSLQDDGTRIGPDLAHWGKYVNPIVWAQQMWENAPKMEAEMSRIGMKWPKLEGNDMINLITYLKNLEGTGEKEYLNPGSPDHGKELFSEKGCISCHTIRGEGSSSGPGPDLGLVEIPRTLTQMASLMWNHSPEMRKLMQEKGVESAHISAQEMADIISYIFAVRYFDEKGDAQRGSKIFREKGCIKCHSKGNNGGDIGPELTQYKGRISPIFIGQLMWKHGPSMLERLTEMGMPWPTFSEKEMVDLIEYLNSDVE